MRSLRFHHLAAGGVFLLFLLRPAYIIFLRHELAARMPEYWASLPNNGSFALLLPDLSATRYSDEALYASRTRQILLHGVPSNPYWKGDRGLQSWLTDCISHYLLAGMAALCGGRMTLSWILSGALLGSLWFLLYHEVFKWWCGRTDVAIPLALFSVLFPDLYLFLLDINFSVAINLKRYVEVFFQHHGVIRPYFYRLPSLFLSMYLLSSLLVGTVWLAGQRNKRPLWAALLGLGYGLMVLVHPFEFAFGMATLFVFSVAVWALGSFQSARWNITLTAAASALVPIAYIVLFLSPVSRSGALRDTNNMFPTHKFYLITLIHVIFALFGAHQLRREPDPGRRTGWLLLISAQLAALLCRNAQVVLGYENEIMHYIPIGSFFGCAMLSLWISRDLSQRAAWDKRLGIAASALILVWTLGNEKAAAERTYQMLGLPRDTEAALHWVDQRMPAESLILSLSAVTNRTIPLYTRATVQVPAIGINHSAPFTLDQFLVSVARLLKTTHADEERFLSERWLMSGPKEDVRGRTYSEQYYLQKVDLAGVEQGEWFYSYFVLEPNRDELITRAKARLRVLCGQATALERPFYIWVDARDAGLFIKPPDAFGGKLLYENPSVKIYGFS